MLTLHAAGDAELEVWATARHLEPFEELVKKPVRLELASSGVAAPLPKRQPRKTGPKLLGFAPPKPEPLKRAKAAP